MRAAEYNLRSEGLMDCLAAARSPHTWRRTMAAAAKPAMAVLYRFAWINNVESAPTLKQGPLLGTCLEREMFRTKEQAPQAVRSKERYGQCNPVPAFRRTDKETINGLKRCKPIQQQTQGRGSARDRRVACDTDSAAAVSSNNRSAKHSAQQVCKQKKIAPSTVLRACGRMKNFESMLQQQFGARRHSRPLNRWERKAPEPNARAKKLATVAPPAAPATKRRWQRQIEERIETALAENQTPQTAPASNSKTPRIAPPVPVGKNPWREPLVTDDGTHCVSTWALFDLMEGQFPSQISVGENRISPPIKSTSSALISQTGSVTQRSDGIAQTLAKSEFPGGTATPAENVEADPRARDFQFTEKRQTKHALGKHTLDRGENSPAQAHTGNTPDAIDTEPPEFPPIAKVINEELRSSGLRTPLKSETERPSPTLVLDEEELADALKEILDEQARRHGIDV